MKSDPSFPKLPSVGELLKHPSVERIVDRVNQTTIAQRATGFLEELRSHERKHAGQGIVPSIHQLAERFARQLLGPAEHSFPIVNATGAVWSDRWPAPPLADAAVHAVLRVASEYHEAEFVLRKRILESLCELTGAEAAAVGNSFERTSRLALESGGSKIDVATHAGLFDPADFSLNHVDTVPQRVAAGAELVVCNGAGLLGGPRCSIIVGRRKQIERIVDQLSAAEENPSVLTLAALDATLDIYRRQERIIHQIPTLQLLSTPLANLQLRSEKLAPLLQESDLVAQAEPVQAESIWYDTEVTKLSGPTWAVRLQPVANSLEELVRTLQENSPQIVTRGPQDAVWLDLRSVFPRWDQTLAASVAQES